MTQAQPHPSLSGTRLVRFLIDLEVADVELSHRHFAERLSQLIDLPDSISLARAHGNIASMPFEPAKVSAATIKEGFLQARASLVQSVIQSVATGSAATIACPAEAQVNDPIGGTDDLEPYVKHYSTQQRKIDFAVQKLHSDIRTACLGLSPQLAQLSELDRALNATLSIRYRRCFAVIPKLLQKRYRHLVGKFQQERQNHRRENELWLQLQEQYRSEVQGLLLAELETRLLPVLGLIEAIDEEFDKTTYE